MGTIFKIICYAHENDSINEKIDKSFALIDSLNQIFSDYLPDSELNRLCSQSGNGYYIEVSELLFDIIQKSLYWSAFSHGIFDISVGPYTQLWRRAIRQEKIPEQTRIDQAAESVGYKYIKLNKKKMQVLLKKKNMQLDFGGIGQGYAVDMVYKQLLSMNIPICLVDGGGDIYAGDPPPGEAGWKIAFEDLEKNNKTLILKNQAISTSGDLYHFMEFKGIRYSHIIDPETGFGMTIPRTATIIAPNTTSADALTKIAIIGGPQKGFNLITKLKNVKALIIQKEGDNLKRYELGTFDFKE
jgi:thiamine biosynthesis lipoprotein